MDTTMQALRKKMPSKRALTSTINQIVQQKCVAVLYTPTEVERIKQMTDMITQATSEFEADEDWDRILRVVDALSNVSNHAVLKESIRYLKLRLGDPSSHVIILALTLTESIVKNCGDLVHQEIATEHFMGEMEALYRTHAKKRGRKSMEIASRVLDMVQAWGEAFLPLRHNFPLFVDTYHNMRKKGIKFPDQYDESKVPVLTPSLERLSGGQSRVAGTRSLSSSQARGSSAIDTSSYSNISSGLGGLSTPELYRVAMNVLEMFDDMLFEAQKDQSSISSHGVMAELAVEMREIVHRLEGAISIAVVEEDKNLAKYLSINDDLHAVMKQYDVLLTENRKSSEEAVATSDIDLIDPVGLKDDLFPHDDEDNQRSNDEDPFADFVRARTVSKIATVANTPEKARPEGRIVVDSNGSQLNGGDPFASFVQQRVSKICKGISIQDAEKTEPAATLDPVPSATDLIDLWDADPAQRSEFLFGDGLPGISSQQAELMRTTQLESPAQDPWSGKHFSLTSSVSVEPVSPKNSVGRPSLSDPFDMLDFSTKASISTLAPANPFNSIISNPTAQPQQPVHPVASKSFNPFDS